MRVDSAFTLKQIACRRDERRKIRILSVDDDELNQTFIAEILGDFCDVQVAMDGEEALAIVDQFKPDVILLDVIMPGMSGYEVCRALRAMPQQARVKIIFTSAKTRPREREEGYVAGGNDYISKPFSYDELVGKVNIFAQMQRIEDECWAYKRESERLRAYVRLLECMNHARCSCRVFRNNHNVVGEVLSAYVGASEVEGGLFLVAHEEFGVRYAVFARLNDVVDLNIQGINLDKGAVADLLSNEEPVVYRHLGLSTCALGLPKEAFGIIDSVLSVSFPIAKQERGSFLLINKRYGCSFSEEDSALAALLVSEFVHSFCDKT